MIQNVTKMKQTPKERHLRIEIRDGFKNECFKKNRLHSCYQMLDVLDVRIIILFMYYTGYFNLRVIKFTLLILFVRV